MVLLREIEVLLPMNIDVMMYGGVLRVSDHVEGGNVDVTDWRALSVP